MQAYSENTSTYILLNGIIVSENVQLSENIELQPADTSHLDFNTAISTCSRPDDISVIVAFIPRITSQLHICAPTLKKLAIHAWNSSWDALLLGALFNTEIGFNIQSDVSAEKIFSESSLRATNYYMRGMNNIKPYELTNDDIRWIAINFKEAKKLMKDERFQTAVHCMASYRWHSMPRIKLAVLWSGIEGMFGVSTELRFRISLYIAKFLHENDLEKQKLSFETVKKLYDYRSSAVHGSTIKSDINEAVDNSANILQRILLKCVSNKSIPKENELVP